MSLFGVLTTAGSGMVAQSVRLNATASNLANVDATSDTEKNAYHAKLPVFKTMTLNESNALHGVKVVKVTHSKDAAPRVYQPANPQADKDGYVYGSNVNRIEQLTEMISASQAYQANAQVANSCKELLMNTIALIKQSH